MTIARITSAAAHLALLLQLLWAGPASSAVFQAGPDSTPLRTIEEALAAALAAGGDNEVRIQQGVFPGLAPLLVPTSFDSGSLLVSGGWTASFDQIDPAQPSTLESAGAGSILDLQPRGGLIALDILKLTGGVTASTGGGIYVSARNGAQVYVTRCEISGNEARFGGGVYAELEDQAELVLRESRLAENLGTSATTTASGAGLEVFATDESIVTIQNNEIEYNELYTEVNQATGAGIYLELRLAASADLSDNEIRFNETTGPGFESAAGSAIWSTGSGDASGHVTLRRNSWIENNDRDGGFAAQLSLIGSGTAIHRVSDSVIAGGASAGVVFEARDASEMFLTNLTIIGNAGDGIADVHGEGAAASFYNSIAFGNGSDAPLDATDSGSNLIGVDPLFVDPGAYDFSLQSTSPAIGGGDPSPPGGLGELDLLGEARIFGGEVDRGAIEYVPEPRAALAAIAALAALARSRGPDPQDPRDPRDHRAS